MNWVDLRALAIIVWRQGIRRSTRFRFWKALYGMARHNPKRFKGFIAILAHNEHFLEYRAIVRNEIEAQLARFHRSLPSPLPHQCRSLFAALISRGAQSWM